MTELHMFGYRARLILDLPAGDLDVTEAVELITTADMRQDHHARAGFWVNNDRLLAAITNHTKGDYRQAALELHSEIRNAMAWMATGAEPSVAHNALLKTADKWRGLLEEDDV